MSKFVKLLGHYIRYPVDLLLLPISIIFGYLHGLIKAKAMLSLNVVSHDFCPVLVSLRPIMMWPAVGDPSEIIPSTDDPHRQHGVHVTEQTTMTHIA